MPALFVRNKDKYKGTWGFCQQVFQKKCKEFYKPKKRGLLHRQPPLFSQIKIPDRHQGQKDPVDPEGGKGGPLEEFHEPDNGQVPYHEGSDEPNGQHRQVSGAETGQILQQFKQAGRHHNGQGHDEGKVRPGLPVHPHQQGSSHGGAAPGEPGPQGQELEEADVQGLPDADVIHILDQFLFMALDPMFRIDHQQSPQNQADGHRSRREQIFLDEGVDQEGESHGGHAAGGNMPAGEPVSQLPALFGQEPGEPFLVEHQHRQDGPQLDHYIKDLGQVPFEADHMAHNDHMAGGRYGDEFRQAFHNAQQHRNQIFTHNAHSFFSSSSEIPFRFKNLFIIWHPEQKKKRRHGFFP